jgi:hypothetical protein
VRDGHAGQRAGLAAGTQGIGGLGLGQGLVGVNRNEGVECRVVRLDAAKVILA